MAKDSTAAEEISKWCEMNPPEAKYTRKKFIDWAQFTKRYGQRHSTVDRRKSEPMMEKEFTLWAENIKGFTPSEAKDWWQEFLDNPAITRDFKGFRGRLQLWIPKSITKENLVETYIDSCQERGSKASKKPADKVMESLRQHVGRQRTIIGVDYFHSGSASSSQTSPAGKRARDGGPNDGTPQAKKTKDHPVELEREGPKLYATMEKGVKTVMNAMRTSYSKLTAAKDAFQEYDSKLACKDVALITILKNLQLRALLVCHFLREPLDGFQFLPLLADYIESPVEGMQPAVLALLKKECALHDTNSSATLAALLKDNNGRLPWVGEPEDFQTHEDMELQRAKAFDLPTIKAFEELKTSWKAAVDACTAVASSSTKVAADVMQHLKTRAAETKRSMVRQEQSKQNEELRRVRDSAKKAAEEIKRKHQPVEVVNSVFTVDLDFVPPLTQISGIADASSIDWSRPFCWRNCETLKLCLGDETLQKSFSSWAKQYKAPTPPGQQADPSGRHQYPLQTKLGKEVVEQFFQGLKVPHVMDISDITGGAAFMASSWLFGYDVDMKFTGFYPNNAAFLRAHVLGEISCIFFDVASVVDFVSQKDRAAALDYQSYGSLIADLNTTTLKEWVDAGVLIFTHVAKAGDLIYVPTGWSGVEQTRPEQRLVYGFRKVLLAEHSSELAELRCVC